MRMEQDCRRLTELRMILRVDLANQVGERDVLGLGRAEKSVGEPLDIPISTVGPVQVAIFDSVPDFAN